MTQTMRVTVMVAALAANLAPAGANAEIKLETGRRAQVSEDGLHMVARSAMRDATAWVKPGLDLARYDKVLALPTGVSFRPVEAPPHGVRGGGEQTEFPVSDEMKIRIRSAFREAFQQELAKVKEYEVTPLVGADVLAVQAFLVDVVAHFPPAPGDQWNAGFDRTWDATIVLELRDSTTETILARTVEREQVRPEGDATAALWTHTEGLLKRWARLVCTHLAQLTDSARD
jgi:hypothetical protein